MYAGKIVEVGPVNEMFYNSRHPYTYGLIHAVPTLSGEQTDLISIPGSPPDLIDLPPGCKFHPRCPYATEICQGEEPTLEKQAHDHLAACYHIAQLIADRQASVCAASAGGASG
jgi:oligopeptide/dipeptide ABC transporter ATP-binding protein